MLLESWRLGGKPDPLPFPPFSFLSFPFFLFSLFSSFPFILSPVWVCFFVFVVSWGFFERGTAESYRSFITLCSLSLFVSVNSR